MDACTVIASAVAAATLASPVSPVTPEMVTALAQSVAKVIAAKTNTRADEHLGEAWLACHDLAKSYNPQFSEGMTFERYALNTAVWRVRDALDSDRGASRSNGKYRAPVVQLDETWDSPAKATAKPVPHEAVDRLLHMGATVASGRVHLFARTGDINHAAAASADGSTPRQITQSVQVLRKLAKDNRLERSDFEG